MLYEGSGTCKYNLICNCLSIDIADDKKNDGRIHLLDLQLRLRGKHMLLEKSIHLCVFLILYHFLLHIVQVHIQLSIMGKYHAEYTLHLVLL